MRRPITKTFEWVSYLSDEAETPVWIDYTYIPGYPASGPDWSSGGEPGSGPEVEIVKVYQDGGLGVDLSEADKARIIADIAENHDTDQKAAMADYLREDREDF